MAGLDTRGLADGFAQGFGLMNQYQRGQRADKRAEQQMSMQQERMDMQREQFGAQQDEVQHARDMEDIQFTLGKISSGMDVGEDEVELLRKHPKFWAALDSQTDASIEQAQNVIDPESPVDANDPESLAALNQMFGAEINKGDGGEKRVSGMFPSPDGESVMLELEVIGEDGQPYSAPMTEGRGTGDDDLVMEVPVEGLVGQVQGMRTLRNAFRSQEAQAQASKLLGILRGDPEESWEQVNGPGGAIFQRNTRTGEMKSLLGRAPVRGGRGGAKTYAPTATMKEAGWMVANGVAPDIETAFGMLKSGTGDSFQRDKLQLNMLNKDIDRIDDHVANSRLRPGDPEYEEAQQRKAELQEQRAQVEGRVFGGGSSQPQQPVGDSRQAPEPSGNAPAAAVEYLRNNDSPELREQFEAKYGGLPEGF